MRKVLQSLENEKRYSGPKTIEKWWHAGEHFGVENPQATDSQGSPFKGSEQDAPCMDNKSVTHASQEPKAKKSKSKISDEKLRLYEEYTTPKPVASTKRCKVDPAAHEWMQERLRQWQDANGKGKLALPYSNEWYLDARVDCIKAELITKEHSEHVVRSYLRSYIKKLEGAMGGEADASEVDDIEDID